MRNLDALDDELREMIRSMYIRPQMYASARCVESVLWTAHRCWSLLHERETEFQDLYHELADRHRANGGHYAQYRDANPDGSEKDAYRFIFERWATISQSLGLKVPDSWD
jgi:hypothetical protein